VHLTAIELNCKEDDVRTLKLNKFILYCQILNAIVFHFNCIIKRLVPILDSDWSIAVLYS